MSSFPFLRLPELVQLEVIRNCEFPDIFRFSDCSRRVRTIIQNANIALLGLEIDISEDEVYFDFGFPRTARTFLMSISTNDGYYRDRERLSGGIYPALQFGRWHHGIQAEEHELSVKAAETLSHLLSLFNRTELTLLKLETSLCVKDLTREVVKPHFSVVQHLYIIKKYNEHQQEPEFGGLEEQLIWTFDNIKATDSIFTMFWSAQNRFRRGFEAEVVRIIYPSWIHSDVVINSTTKTFRFINEHPTSQFMNAIVKAWISNEKLTNLELFSWDFDWVDDDVFGFQNQSMNGIEEAVLTPEEQEKESRNIKNNVDFKNFVRRIDGKLAVLLMDETMVRFRVC